jgi:hypothetical protein
MTLEQRILTEIVRRAREGLPPLTPRLVEKYGHRPVEWLRLFMKHLFDMRRVDIQTIPKTYNGEWLTRTTYHPGPELVARLHELEQREANP